MGCWLVKSDPDTYGWKDLVRDGKTCWDGVRSFAARSHLRGMKPGDEVLFYHSGTERAVVGGARVASDPYPDPTAKEEDWTAVDIAPAWALRTPVGLPQIKSEASLKNIRLVKEGRLSVMPLEKVELEKIVGMGGGRVTL